MRNVISEQIFPNAGHSFSVYNSTNFYGIKNEMYQQIKIIFNETLHLFRRNKNFKNQNSNNFHTSEYVSRTNKNVNTLLNKFRTTGGVRHGRVLNSELCIIYFHFLSLIYI